MPIDNDTRLSDKQKIALRQGLSDNLLFSQILRLSEDPAIPEGARDALVHLADLAGESEPHHLYCMYLHPQDFTDPAENKPEEELFQQVLEWADALAK